MEKMINAGLMLNTNAGKSSILVENYTNTDTTHKAAERNSFNNIMNNGRTLRKPSTQYNKYKHMRATIKATKKRKPNGYAVVNHSQPRKPWWKWWEKAEGGSIRRNKTRKNARQKY